MIRFHSSTRSGVAFSEQTKLAVWKKANTIWGEDPDVKRKDRCGATILYAKYGDTTPMGWEIDHMKPVSEGGGDELENLQPLQWENNRAKADHYPAYNYCVVNN